MNEPRVLEWEHADEHREALAKLVSRMRRLYPHSKLGVMRGGWSSPKRLHREPEIAPLLEWVGTQGRIEAWANVLQPGDLILEHTHHQARETAIYCLEGEGELQVKDADPIVLSPGRLVILAGWQVHSVAPVESARTSIVMNIYG